MGASEKIHQLKLILGDQFTLAPKESWKAPHVASGVPKGALVELIGTAKVEWLLTFLQAHPEAQVFWYEKKQKILPTAFVQRGVALERVTFALLEKDLMTSLRRVIQSQIFDVIVGPNEFHEIKTYKALQLLSEKANSTFFLLGGERPSQAWPISMQLQIQRHHEKSGGLSYHHFSVEVLKQKQGVFL